MVMVLNVVNNQLSFTKYIFPVSDWPAVGKCARFTFQRFWESVNWTLFFTSKSYNLQLFIWRKSERGINNFGHLEKDPSQGELTNHFF